MGDLIGRDMVVGQSEVSAIHQPTAWACKPRLWTTAAPPTSRFALPWSSRSAPVSSLRMTPNTTTDSGGGEVRSVKMSVSETKAAVFAGSGNMSSSQSNVTTNALKMRLIRTEANAADSRC